MTSKLGFSMAMAGPAVNISKAKSVRHIGISNQ